jgi:hypothetical protein
MDARLLRLSSGIRTHLTHGDLPGKVARKLHACEGDDETEGGGLGV